ncbi:MAG: flagellar export protein FliJ [Proteobacteria bacterium]|nr:flagellar export protein FliJ [Pseudomonadota bacterium]
MKRFRFRLQPVLDFREHQERMAKIEVAKARQNIIDCSKKIEALTKDLNDTARDLDLQTQKGMSVERFRFFTNYLSSIEVLITREENRRKILIRQLSDKQRALKQKIIERKTLETLKNKQKDTYYNDLRNMLQKEADDMVAIRRKEEIEDGIRSV